MSQPMDLSVIIVSWNTQDYLRRCLQLLKASTDKCLATDVETFVVDNASGDASVDMVQQIHPWVRVIRNTRNAGFARANNQAIALSRGRYVLLLNPDTEVPPGFIGSLKLFADAHPGAGVVGPKLVNPDGSFQAGPNRFPTLLSVILESWGFFRHIAHNPYYPSYPPAQSNSPMECDWVGGACLLARRTAIDEVGVLDEDYFMYSEEVDWCYRMKKSGWEVWYTPTPTVTHLGGVSADRSTAVQRMRTYRGKVRFLAKHRGASTGLLAKAHFRSTSLAKAVVYRTLSLLCSDHRHREAAASHWAVAWETNWT